MAKAWSLPEALESWLCWEEVRRICHFSQRNTTGDVYFIEKVETDQGTSECFFNMKWL